jgi:hypothetical protein
MPMLRNLMCILLQVLMMTGHMFLRRIPGLARHVEISRKWRHDEK